MPRGGRREGSGRKSKKEELKLVETIMSAGKRVRDTDTPLEDLWEVIMRQAYEGSKEHQKFVLEYTYGKPTQRIEADVTGPQVPTLIFQKAE